MAAITGASTNPLVDARPWRLVEELADPSGASAYDADVADLLALGSLALGAPVLVVGVRKLGGGWAVLGHGLEGATVQRADPLLDRVWTHREAQGWHELAVSAPHCSLLRPPHDLRWACGLPLPGLGASAAGVVVALDWSRREVTQPTGQALIGLTRLLAAALTAEHLDCPPASSRLLRAHQVAKMFMVTERTVANWVTQGRLRGIRTAGGHLRFRHDDVVALLEQSRRHAAGG